MLLGMALAMVAAQVAGRRGPEGLCCSRVFLGQAKPSSVYVLCTRIPWMLSPLRGTVQSRPRLPPEHVIVFDEGQPAFDPERIAKKHSEPDLMIEIADRVPEWCVVIGLIGSGQEIHIGEEAGIG